MEERVPSSSSSSISFFFHLFEQKSNRRSGEWTNPRLKWKWKLSKFELNRNWTNARAYGVLQFLNQVASINWLIYVIRYSQRTRAATIYFFVFVLLFVKWWIETRARTRLPNLSLPILHSHFVNHLDARASTHTQFGHTIPHPIEYSFIQSCAVWRAICHKGKSHSPQKTFVKHRNVIQNDEIKVNIRTERRRRKGRSHMVGCRQQEARKIKIQKIQTSHCSQPNATNSTIIIVLPNIHTYHLFSLL